MSIRARGQHRFGDGAKPNDLTITRKNGAWFASVTLRVSEDACARARTGEEHRGVDFGLTDWATFDNGETIDNPRFVRNEMPHMADLQRQQARKKRGSIRYQRLGKQVAKPALAQNARPLRRCASVGSARYRRHVAGPDAACNRHSPRQAQHPAQL